MISLRLAPAAARVSAAVAVIAAVACSSSGPAVPQAYIMATVDPGMHASNVCPILATVSGWVTIGSTSGSKADGDDQNGAAVSVQCTVKANGDGTFTVLANASLSGPNGGSVFISGSTFAPPPAVIGNVTGKFQRGDTGGGGAFVEQDCTVTFTGDEGVAAGRVWGSIECPNIVDSEQMVVGSNPPMNWTCEGGADFKFENCAQ